MSENEGKEEILEETEEILEETEEEVKEEKTEIVETKEVEEPKTVERKSHPFMITVMMIVLFCVFMGIGFALGGISTYNDAQSLAINNCKENVENNTTKETTVEEDEKETTEEETTEEEKTTTETKTTEDKVKCEEAVDNSSNVEKVYGWNEDSIILFKSGNCVVSNGSEYTATCKYTIENKTLTITRRETGPNNGSEKTYTYNITTDNNNDEYLELSTNKDTKYKLFK